MDVHSKLLTDKYVEMLCLWRVKHMHCLALTLLQGQWIPSLCLPHCPGLSECAQHVARTAGGKVEPADFQLSPGKPIFSVFRICIEVKFDVDVYIVHRLGQCSRFRLEDLH